MGKVKNQLETHYCEYCGEYVTGEFYQNGDNKEDLFCSQCADRYEAYYEAHRKE